MKSQVTRRLSTRIGFIAALIGLGFVSTCQALEPTTTSLTIGDEPFTLEVADNFITRQRGLMHRDDLGECGGMVFFFSKTRPVSFWMKDTPSPLWMAFVDKNNRISHIHPRATPFDETPISSGWPVNRVIEVHADCPKLAHIKPGDMVMFDVQHAHAGK